MGRAFLAAVAAVVVCLTAAAMAGGQAAPPQRPPMAEEVFWNIRVLKGIPVDEFMGTMGFFSASLGLNCTDCHVEESGGNWARYADDNALKQMSRVMMVMVNTITRIDYDDYREVAGVRMPFRWTVRWLSGRSTYELTDVQPNVQIPATRFALPAR